MGITVHNEVSHTFSGIITTIANKSQVSGLKFQSDVQKNPQN